MSRESMHQIILVQKARDAHVACGKGLLGKCWLVLSCLLEDGKTTHWKTPVVPLCDELNEFLLDVVKETFRALMIMGLVSDIT